jgi:hypothetical protein
MSGCGVVTFDYTTWAAMFPELACSVPCPLAQGFFNRATLQLDNSPISQIQNLGKRSAILNLLTAHIAALNAPVGGNEPNPLVGRVSNASEGSVSVAVDFPLTINSAWMNQTKYGAEAWSALAPYRTALYVAAPQIPRSWQSYPLQYGPFYVGGQS